MTIVLNKKKFQLIDQINQGQFQCQTDVKKVNKNLIKIKSLNLKNFLEI